MFYNPRLCSTIQGEAVDVRVRRRVALLLMRQMFGFPVGHLELLALSQLDADECRCVAGDTQAEAARSTCRHREFNDCRYRLQTVRSGKHG